MILLDTNVVSEIISENPDPTVLSWAFQQPTELMYVSAIAVAEIRFGAATMDLGQRRDRLLDSIEALLRDVFGPRVLPFDLDAANAYPQIMTRRRAIGRAIKAADGQIAAIAQTRDMPLATRNTKDFEEIGLALINPWFEE